MLKMHQIAHSSAVTAVGYDPMKSELVVHYKKGTDAHHFAGVHPSAWKAIEDEINKGAEGSVGKALHANVTKLGHKSVARPRSAAI